MNNHHIENITKTCPKIEGRFQVNEKGISEIVGIKIGDLKVSFIDKENKFSLEKLKELDKSISTALGLPNMSITLDVIFDIARTLPCGLDEASFNRIIALIASEKPRDSVQAVLLGQFFLLNEIGTYSWRNANNSDMLSQANYFTKTAVKFLSLSHQAIHALAKHRTRGVQQVNVVHMHDNSKAIMAGEIGGRD